MLILPRHVKIYLENTIQKLDSSETTRELIYEFDCNSEAEQSRAIYKFAQDHHLNWSNIKIEAEQKPIPEQTAEDVYEALEHCVSIANDEGLLYMDEYRFLLDWLQKNVVNKE